MLFYQPDTGYRYNSDSLFLYDFISSFKPRGRMLDVGAGSGVVGLLVARDNPRVELVAVEKQDVFTFLATKNAEVNNISYTLHQTDFLEYEDEKGFEAELSTYNYYADKQIFPHLLANLSYGFLLPIEHSSLWLRTSFGISSGDSLFCMPRCSSTGSMD